MMLHAVYLLIVLVPLAGNEDDITFLCHHGRGTDGLLAVDNREDFLFLRGVKACEHIVDDCLRVLVARVVARENDGVTLPDGLLCH